MRWLVKISSVLCTLICVFTHVSGWILQRAVVDESRVIFHNTTVTGDQTYCSWLWMDSHKGVWEVSARMRLSSSAAGPFKSGSFVYNDALGRGLLRVGWKKRAGGRAPTWRLYYAATFPRTWWNLTAGDVQLDYRRPSGADGDSGTFHVDGQAVKLNARDVATMATAVAGTVAMYDDLWPIGWRPKRTPAHSQRQGKRFDILDLFTGNGIFASLPQLFINIFSFFANLFPPGDDDSEDGAVMEATESDAEILTTSTSPATTMASTADAEAEIANTVTKTAVEGLETMTDEVTKSAAEPETMTSEESQSAPVPSERLRNGRTSKG